MPITSVDIELFTFKAGLLARAAHDLKLRAGSVQLERSPDGRLEAVSIPVASIQVVCAMRGKQEDHRALSAANRAEIEDNLRTRVLDAARHPVIRFDVAAIDPHHIRGTLTLRGRSRPLDARLVRRNDHQTATLRIDQRDFGITPFRAAMGALRIQPEVEVVVTLS